MTAPKAPQSGFSLIEIAIALTIAALIVAGILVGSDMIQSAKLQKVATDLNRYANATGQFKAKYQYWPGDMPTATDYWGTRADCDMDTAIDTRAEATCDGNGDSRITGTTGALVSLGTQYHEAIYTWQHLSNAGFVEGSYSGTPSPNTTWYEPGFNVPKGMGETSGFGLNYLNPNNGAFIGPFPGFTGNLNGSQFTSGYGHVITYGGTDQMGKNRTPVNFVLSNYEAREIDGKIDDGKPGTGRLVSFVIYHTAPPYFCSTTNLPETAEYITNTGKDDDAKKCALVYQLEHKVR